MDAHLVSQAPARLEPAKNKSLTSFFTLFRSFSLRSTSFHLVSFQSTSMLFAQTFTVLPPCAAQTRTPVQRYIIVTHDVPVSKFIASSSHFVICVSLQYAWNAAWNSASISDDFFRSTVFVPVPGNLDSLSSISSLALINSSCFPKIAVRRMSSLVLHPPQAPDERALPSIA